MTSWLKEYAGQKVTAPIDAKNLTYAQAAALSAWRSAAQGDLAEYNFIIDKIEGKAPLLDMRNQTVNVTPEVFHAMQATIAYIDEVEAKKRLGTCREAAQSQPTIEAKQP